jgi:hypothetical protein
MAPRILPVMPDHTAELADPMPTASGRDSMVAETMRRVHEDLRRGAAPSFEALLAFGEPA